MSNHLIVIDLSMIGTSGEELKTVPNFVGSSSHWDSDGEKRVGGHVPGPLDATHAKHALAANAKTMKRNRQQAGLPVHTGQQVYAEVDPFYMSSVKSTEGGYWGESRHGKTSRFLVTVEETSLEDFAEFGRVFISLKVARWFTVAPENRSRFSPSTILPIGETPAVRYIYSEEVTVYAFVDKIWVEKDQVVIDVDRPTIEEEPATTMGSIDSKDVIVEASDTVVPESSNRLTSLKTRQAELVAQLKEIVSQLVGLDYGGAILVQTHSIVKNSKPATANAYDAKEKGWMMLWSDETFRTPADPRGNSGYVPVSEWKRFSESVMSHMLEKIYVSWLFEMPKKEMAEIADLLIERYIIVEELVRLNAAIAAWEDMTPVEINTQRNIRNSPFIRATLDKTESMTLVYVTEALVELADSSSHHCWMSMHDWTLFKYEHITVVEDRTVEAVDMQLNRVDIPDAQQLLTQMEQ